MLLPACGLVQPLVPPAFVFEFKRTVAPALTKSMRVVLADLRLRRLDVIHAGERTYPLAPRVRSVALGRVLQDIAPL